MVGAWRFELQTSCAQGSCKKSISLVRLALFCVVVLGFGPNSSTSGPKLDLTFRATRQTAGRRSPCPALYQCHFAVEIWLLFSMEL